MPPSFFPSSITKILAHRDCHPSQLEIRERRSGPAAKSRSGEWLVLGEFLEAGFEEADDDDQHPERGQPWLWWVHEDDLFRYYHY